MRGHVVFGIIKRFLRQYLYIITSLTNIGDLNMRKRILFGSMLVIICMLLLPSTSALQTGDEPKDEINLESVKDIQSLDYNQLSEFFIELSEDYPLIQEEITDQIEEIDDQDLEDLTNLADSNQSFIEKAWLSIFNYRSFRLYLSLCLFAYFQSKLTLMRSLTWGIKLLRWVKVGIILGIVDPSPEEPPETPVISFYMDDVNDTLTVTSVTPEDTLWGDIDQIGSGVCDPLPTGNVSAGDKVTNCSGIIVLRYIPTNGVIGVYEFD